MKISQKTIIVVIILLVATLLIYRTIKKDKPANSISETEIKHTKSTDNLDNDDKETYIENIETMPQYPGGDDALMKFLSKNIEYPISAQENGIEGRVIIGFVVDKNGSIKDAKILRGVEKSIDKEALRVVNLLGKWIPGEQKGKKVNVRYTLPIAFKLQ